MAIFADTMPIRRHYATRHRLLLYGMIARRAGSILRAMLRRRASRRFSRLVTDTHAQRKR